MRESYWSLMRNVPHLEWELTLTLIQDVLIGLVIWPRLRRWLKREHLKQDREHGVVHSD